MHMTDHNISQLRFRYITQRDLFDGDGFARGPVEGLCKGCGTLVNALRSVKERGQGGTDYTLERKRLFRGVRRVAFNEMSNVFQVPCKLEILDPYWI